VARLCGVGACRPRRPALLDKPAAAALGSSDKDPSTQLSADTLPADAGPRQIEHLDLRVQSNQAAEPSESRPGLTTVVLPIRATPRFSVLPPAAQRLG
jgi:hypothetical protein